MAKQNYIYVVEAHYDLGSNHSNKVIYAGAELFEAIAYEPRADKQQHSLTITSWLNGCVKAREHIRTHGALGWIETFNLRRFLDNKITTLRDKLDDIHSADEQVKVRKELEELIWGRENIFGKEYNYTDEVL